MNIVDLHCDLLSYLAAKPGRDPLNPIIRCSGPQLKAGNVTLQTLAIFSETTDDSFLFGLKQIEIFLSLSQKYPDYFTEDNIVPAFENASAFALENEPLDDIFTRLENILTQITPLYISLTWNGENRFGGGCGSQAGLKPDGKELLQFLSGRGIAIDFSHTTDKLARDILNTIDTHNLDLRVLASHSNFRAVHDHIRNLPDEIAQEIIRRKGLIGFVLYKAFLGAPENLQKQIEHGLKLGAQNALAFGADFFCLDDFSGLVGPNGGFFESMSDASKYPSILAQLALSEEMLLALSSQNAHSFIKKETTIEN
ncbi:MAG: hypothetical protein K1000chlam2_00178 [Chlamydiae bacterium]|nr:hypothetical protein [Chlamydiota bacterium]